MDSDKLGNSFRSFSVKNYMKERVYFSCGFAAGKEKKKKEGPHVGREVKLSFYTDDILYVENPPKSIKRNNY